MAQAPTTSNRKRNILVVAILLAILAIGLALGLTLRDKDSSSASAAADGSSTSQDGVSGESMDSNNPTTPEEQQEETNDEGDTTDTTPTAAATWPHEESDIPKDPKLRVGTLDNGLKYMILPHPWPTSKVSFRLHIDAGALHEDDDQNGLAHFLEHMMFNGLRSYEGNELVAVMQRFGMDIGPHINAYTTYDETVYRLESPDNTTEVIDLCFTVMRDWLDGALLDVDEIEAERGVVVSELQGGDQVRRRLSQQLYEFLIPSSLITRRNVIGTVESLQNLAPQEFVEFYKEYYTPKRATFVVAGDIEVDEIEAQVIETFSSATNPENPGQEPDMGDVNSGSGFRSAVFTEEEFKYHEVYLYTAREYMSKPDTRATREAELSMAFAERVFKQRLEILVKAANSSISYGSASRYNVENVEIGYVTVDAIAGKLEEAIMVLEQEFRRLLTFGITMSEFEETKAVVLNAYERSAAGAETRESSNLASALSDSVNARSVFSSPEVNLDIVSDALATLTPERVHQDFATYWDTEDIALIFLTKEASDNTTEVMEMAYKQSQMMEVEPPADNSNMTFSYTDFGEPGTIVSDMLQEDLDIRQLVLSNGVRVNMKTTDFEANSILLNARVGSGKLSQPQNTDLDVFAAYVMNLGGLGNHSQDDLDRLMAGKSVGVGFSIANDHFVFSGETQPDDLELELQLLAAHIVDPGYREEGVRIYQQQIPIRLNDYVHTLDGPQSEMSQFLKGGDERYGIPTEEEMLSYTVDDLKSWLSSQLMESYMEFSIVGDLPDDAVDMILRTLGAIPARADAVDTSAFDNQLTFPETPQEVTLTYNSKEPQAMVLLAFETFPMTASTINDARYMNILATAMDQRVFNEVREEMGAAYSPGAVSSPYDGFDHGEFFVYAMTDPSNVTVVGDRMKIIADSVAQDGINEDDFLRAREPILSNLELTLQSNSYWLSVMDASQAAPYTLDWARNRDEVYRNATVEDINQLAATYLPVSQSVLVSMVPESSDDSSSTSTGGRSLLTKTLQDLLSKTKAGFGTAPRPLV